MFAAKSRKFFCGCDPETGSVCAFTRVGAGPDGRSFYRRPGAKGLHQSSRKWNNGQKKMRGIERTNAVEGPATEAWDLPSEPVATGTFTRYVQAIAARSRSADEMAEDVRAALRKVLVRELRWRSLWTGSPVYVGILGWTSWAPGDTEGTTSPLDDLLSDAYLFVFGKHLQQLLNQLRVSPTIDGLVVVYVRHFLTDRQKHHDPLGYRLFEMSCAVVRGSVAAQELHVLRGTPAIRNETILGAVPDADPAQASSVERLRPLVARWNDALLPDLITAERAARRKVSENLRDRLLDLEAEGVVVFRFKDLLDALKEDVRARWGHFYRQEDGETAIEEDADGIRQLVHILRPEMRIEDLDGFKKLVRCVSNLIPKVDTRQKTRVYLEKLWNFLRRWSLGVREALPSHRDLEGELEIPRDRFPGLYQTLAQLTRRCQGTLSGAVVEIDAVRHRPETTAGGHDG